MKFLCLLHCHHYCCWEAHVSDYLLRSLRFGVVRVQMKKKHGPCFVNITPQMMRICLPRCSLWYSLYFGPGDCGLPPNLPFAAPVNQLYGTTFSTGTILKYACRHGFRKINSSHLTCDENGSWVYTVFCASEYPPGSSPVLTLLRECL